MRSYTLPALPSWQTVHYGILLVQIPIRDVPETSHQHLARSRAQRRASSSPTTRLVARILQHEPFAKWNHRSISLPRGPRWKPMALLLDKAKCFLSASQRNKIPSIQTPRDRPCLFSPAGIGRNASCTISLLPPEWRSSRGSRGCSPSTAKPLCECW